MLVDDSRDACRRILEPFHARLYAVPHYAFERFMAIPDELRLPLEVRKRSMATALWSFEMVAVEALFGELPGVTLHHAYESVLVEIANTTLVRFKKVNLDGLSASYPTTRALEFNSSENGELFDGPMHWSAPIRCDLGYTLSFSEATARWAIDSIRVVRRSGKSVKWQYEIGGDDSTAAGSVPTVTPPVGPVRIIAKRTDVPQRAVHDNDEGD